MYSATYLPDVPTARAELYRLTNIETNLRKNIIDLRTNYKGSADAETWANIYLERLQQNVRPAINECLKYLAKHA
mgnify:CR=1 FL=1